MKPTPLPPRLLPLLSGTAAGSLDPVDLVEIGISAAAVDIVELALGMGLEAVDRLGGLAALTGWEGPLVAVGRTAATAPAATGWRARSLPWLVSDRDGVWELRSSLDGGTTRLSLAELSDVARRLGAEPAASLSASGIEVHDWMGGEPPPRALLVSELAQDEAGRSRFWTGNEWADLALAASETPDGPLAAGCGCRACAIASRGYLAHLLAMREITAEHLLGWHNLYQLRLIVEGSS